MGVRDVLLGAKVPTETVALPELGISVLVRGMTGVERDKFEASCFAGKGKKRDFNPENIRAKLVAFCCVDEQGLRIFSDDDAIALGAVRADLIDRIFGVAQKLSGMREQDLEELGLTSVTPPASNT